MKEKIFEASMKQVTNAAVGTTLGTEVSYLVYLTVKKTQRFK